MNNGMSKEAERSIIAASTMFPGFRFSPTDEELILYYLQKKLDGFHKCVEVIPELDICKYEPWDLPSKAIIKSNEEWFFFSPRGKKYPNGSQSKRATEIGYWKATGKERTVKSGSNVIGTKRTLVFHIGRAPKGERTEWIMHEYCVAGNGQDALVVCRLRRKCDNHAVDDHSGEIQSLPSDPSLLTMESSGTYSGGENFMGLVNTTGSKDKIAECSLKKSSSSHDSHSIEHKDSTSQSDYKTKDEVVLQPQSTSHHAGEDDCFAEILKDSIIQLDECHPPSTYRTQPMATTNTTVPVVPVVPRTYNASHQFDVHRAYPSQQGTANRRIRLPKFHKDGLEEGSNENMVNSRLKQLPKRSDQGWMKFFSCDQHSHIQEDQV